jgi:aspartate aminotransferase
MKYGKDHIFNQLPNELTEMGPRADLLLREAAARGETLPPQRRLHIGEPNFRTPEHIRAAATASINNESQTYSPAAGQLWLRELVAEKIARIDGYQVEPDNLAITLGGTGALQAVLTATLEPGDEILIPDPCWSTYYMQLLTCNIAGISYPLDPQNDWLPALAELEQLVTPRTRMLLINTPGNPSGAVFSRQVVSELLEFAQRHNLYLLSDECYDQLIFEGEHVSPGRLLSQDELEAGHFIGVYSFSKTYSMTGWRIGYAVTGKRLCKTIVDVLNGSHTNINTAIQRAAAAALTGPQDCVEQMRTSYRRRRDLAVQQLKDFGRYVYTPHGAFYLLIDITNRQSKTSDSRKFAFDLLNQRNVVVAPGSAFGRVTAEKYIRISLGASDEDVKQGVQEICLFADGRGDD